jgi:hypothetical protein
MKYLRVALRNFAKASKIRIFSAVDKSQILSFHCRNFAVSNLPMRNCQDTVVNRLLLRNNFVILHVRPVFIGAINPL